MTLRRTAFALLALVACLLASCGGGGGGPANCGDVDTVPDLFDFTPVLNAPLAAPVTSNTVTITGLCGADAGIAVSGDPTSVYSVNGGAFTAASGTVAEGDTVRVRHTGSASYASTTTSTLTVGGVSAIFSSTTVAGPALALVPAYPNLTFSRPVALVQPPADGTQWFVAEQGGVVRAFANDPVATTSRTFIDISGLVGDSSGEKGLLGIAFDPGYATNHYVYLSYTRAAPALTSYVSRFASTDGGQTLDPASEVVLLTLAQPYPNHNGGPIVFGPDGNLYIGFGDGGSANDPGNRAQDTQNLFGTILRIDVSTLPYTIPGDNPFAGNPRCPAGSGAASCPEIYAFGLRNPWRFSFDRQTGELWAGDVGQDAWEEVDRITRGGNYGWRIREGAHCNIPSSGCLTAGLVDPVAEYSHAIGESITGGYVYRGSQLPSLAGSYLFGDFITGRLFRLAGGSTVVEQLLDTAYGIATFGEADDGEIYLADYAGGQVYRLAAAP